MAKILQQFKFRTINILPVSVLNIINLIFYLSRELMTMNPVFVTTFHAILVVLLHLDLQLIGSSSWGAAGAVARCMEMERQALLQLKAGLLDNDGHLSSWGSEETKRDCCEWEGVRCNNQTGHVEVLDLHQNVDSYMYPLTGNFHTSLTMLKHLKRLDLSWNDFQGSIPEFFGSLSNLRQLNLSGCDFSGKIPKELASLSHLQQLDLSYNQLQCTIPYELGNLLQLKDLDLKGNQLVGRIPYQLGNHATLQKLNLGGNLGLEIGQWLPNLTSLTYLDLSNVNNLNHSHTWLQMIGLLSNLRELHIEGCYLSNTYFLSLDPLEFKFPASLTSLDLSANYLTSSIFPWVFNFTSSLVELDFSDNLLEDPIQYNFSKTMNSLEWLDLSYNKLNSSFLKSFKNMSLLSLSLYDNNLNEELSTILHSLHGVRHSLQELKLSWNRITGTLPDLSSFPCLKILELSQNQLYGKIREGIRFPSQFESLAIDSNSLQGGIPQLFGNICTLHSLDLSNNSLSEEFLEIIHNLSGCARYSLQNLCVDDNQISGALPDLSLFSSLKSLRLSHNRLNGKIAEDIRLPSQLEYLDLSLNSLGGVIITEFLFANVSKLVMLDLSYNSLALTYSPHWVPPFQLESIYLAACKIGPQFPKWLQTQYKCLSLDISDAGITDVVPDWFWNMQLRLISMNISYNNLSGRIPDLSPRIITHGEITLASNQFEGSIPPFLRKAAKLNLSKNNFSQYLEFLCPNNTVDKLGVLDLSNSQMTGQLPDCWNYFKSLVYLDLSGNNFSGNIPNSLGSLPGLQALILRSNNLTGELPLSLTSCTNLKMLDVGENRLSGPIPSWIGNELVQLQILILRRNQFFESLPLHLCLLTYIQVLDLSVNNISGQILKCFKNFTSMAETKFPLEKTAWSHSYVYEFNSRGGVAIDYDVNAFVMWKGVERWFKNNKLILKTIDLSSNQLRGQIPAEIGNLVGLVSLNLSRNNMSGKIILELGRLKSLDVLDLSRNHFSGKIPSSLAQIDRLAVLDLSNNNLSGKIPTGTQLQSFDATSYEGNADLCGEPLEKKCPKEEVAQETEELPEDECSIFSEGFYISMALGFITSFWGIFGSIVFNPSWRHAYFKFLDNLTDRIL